eukprot:scaffold10003_cov32-Tisochrysis_lutea.AAC.1
MLRLFLAQSLWRAQLAARHGRSHSYRLSRRALPPGAHRLWRSISPRRASRVHEMRTPCPPTLAKTQGGQGMRSCRTLTRTGTGAIKVRARRFAIE